MRNLIIFHGDADGICSAALLTIYLMKTDEFPVAFISPDFDVIIDPYVEGLIYRFNPERIFVVDLPTDTLKYNFLKDFDVTVIDHHPFSEKPNCSKFIHEDSCCSFIVFKHFKLDDKEAWIAGIGAYGDKDLESFQKLFEITRRFYDLDEKFFVDAMTFISSSRLFGIHGKRAAILALVEAYNMDMPTTVLGSTPNAQKLVEYKKKSRKFKLHLLANLDKYKIFENERFIVVKFSSRIPYQSYIAGVLAHIFKDKIAVAINEWKNFAFVEARTRNNNFNVGEMLRKICGELGGVGGGHKLAGGGRIPAEELEKFLEIIEKA